MTTTHLNGAAPMAAPPGATLECPRDLLDGSAYRLVAAAPGTTTLHLRDPDGDVAVATLDRAEVRRLIEDAELVAGLRPVPSGMDPALALRGSLRRIFERLAELQRTNPAAVAAIVAEMTAHLRSWQPMALGAVL